MKIHDARDALSALGHEGRLEIMRLLLRVPKGMHAGDIAATLHVRPNTLSASLAILANAGLVRRNRLGRHVLYRADIEAMGKLLRFLMQDCCDTSVEASGPVLDEIGTRFRDAGFGI